MPDASGGNADIIAALDSNHLETKDLLEQAVTLLTAIRTLLQNSGGGASAYMPLLNEYLDVLDKDRNGKIFGTDFAFSNPPPILEGVQTQLRDQGKLPSTLMTTEAYWESLS